MVGFSAPWKGLVRNIEWTLTDSFNSGTGEFTRKVERQRVAVQGDSPRKFICAEDVDGQKNNAIV